MAVRDAIETVAKALRARSRNLPSNGAGAMKGSATAIVATSGLGGASRPSLRAPNQAGWRLGEGVTAAVHHEAFRIETSVARTAS